jgi:hypothetical protein
VQAVALVEDQLSVVLPPLVTLEGFALIVTVGGVADVVTVADWVAVPPAPLQVSMNFVVADIADVAADPFMASAPLQPPDAVQEVALVADQLSIEVAPLLTVLGFALRVTAGAGWVTDTVIDCAALPPEPVHVRP